MDETLSVIVPVFQAEKYIDRCVESILSSTYKNLELILVDDGSTDNSSFLCDAWSKKDSRVIVIHKENGGVSNARNEGILHSTGKYLTFVDADDYISPDAYSTSLSFFSENVTSVAFKVFLCDESGKPYYEKPTQGETCSFPTSKDALEYYWYKGKNNSVWCRIFLTEVCKKNNVLFDAQSSINEEGTFITGYLTSTEGISIQLNNRFYYYVTNPNSATRHIPGSQIPKIIENYTSLINMCQEISEVCSVNVSLRYVETLEKLYRTVLFTEPVNCDLARLIKDELKKYSATYYSSKLVPFLRKLYLCGCFSFPKFTFKLGRIKKQSNLRHQRSF